MDPSYMDTTDASEKTSLHILIQRRIQMFDSMGEVMPENDAFYKKWQLQIQENDNVINMLLENMINDNNWLNTIGLSKFHVACMLQDSSVAEHLVDQVPDLNHCVCKDSKLWSGYTALHFASDFNVNTVKMLIIKGADVESKDSRGLTPLDICVERYEIQDIYNIISLSKKWKDIIFSDGKTKLTSFIGALTDFTSFEKFINDSIENINMCIPLESALWPGYTPLHLAVLFAERPKKIVSEHYSDKRKDYFNFQIIKLCLSQGADLSIQDSQGRTPLHLAFRLNKVFVTRLLFREYNNRIPNVSDEDNLSHLHIACAGIEKALKLNKCVLDKSVINTIYKGSLPVNSVRPGSTPLHVCLADPKGYRDSLIRHVINTLLKYGADLYIKDAYGLTPIHWLLDAPSSSFAFVPLVNILLAKAPIDCAVEKYRISYLHVACLVNDTVAAKRFLDNGANANLAIKYTKQHDNDPLSFLSRYDKHTPLHITKSFSHSTYKLLLDHGADVFAKTADDGSTLLANSDVLDLYIRKVWNDSKLQKRMRREFGWTKLHLACYLSKFDGFSDIVKAESADINAKVYSNSPVWKGYTPLHVMMSGNFYYCEKPYTMLRILLKKGADVTKLNDRQESPLNMMFRFSSRVRKYAALMMKYQKNFGINPADKYYGISHFHIACYLNDFDAVKGFLNHGVDVNRSITSADLLLQSYPSAEYIPLHMATDFEVIELLISHGADVNKEDLNGCTVLHKAVKLARYDEKIITKIIESGAEVNKPDFNGRTPFETAILIFEITLEKLNFFIRHGFFVNSCNAKTGVGYVSIMSHYYKDRNLQKTLIEMMMKEKSVNNFGRTTFHHFVTRPSGSLIGDVNFFEKLIKSGHDIDEQDNEGKTALHLAAEFGNSQVTRELLSCDQLFEVAIRFQFTRFMR